MTVTTSTHTASPRSAELASPISARFSSRPHLSHNEPGLDDAISRAQAVLLDQQNPDGYWVGELEGDTTLETEYILLKFILGQENDPDLPLIANYVRRQQNPTGGWSLYPGGADDVSGTVKSYFVLKMMGDDPDAPHMQKARQVAIKLGGIEACNSYTRFYFAALGQISYDDCPAIPPEILFLPRWLYFNLYNVSAWTRTMIVPLSIVTTLRPVRQVPASKGIAELATGNPTAFDELRGLPTNWRELFLFIDRMLKLYHKFPIQVSRWQAIRAAEKWIHEHTNTTGGLGAIFPPMVYILIVMRALGYPDDHPRVRQAHKELHDLFIRQGDSLRIQPCHSPIWDTAIAMHALAETGLTASSDVAHRATTWLLNNECRTASDWQANVPRIEPSGWFFEFSNPHYPDIDDTAMVLMALRRSGGVRAKSALQRGLKWVLAFQNEDGGWAAFDRTRDRPILEKVPFADHNAMQDPSCPDLTGRVFECFGHCGLSAELPAVQKGIKFLQTRQEKEGCWFGRWGVNYVYGTWQVLAGLRSVGADMNADYVRRAADWLRGVQKSDGSWGESCDSYEDPSLKGQGPSTPSQTAWGTMGLLAVAGPNDSAVKKGIRWLIEHQAEDGNWTEPYFTGTGFPKVFYLKYHLYRLYFPLMALGRYRRLICQ